MAKYILNKRDHIRKRLIICHQIANFFFNKFRFFGSRKFSRAISKVILPELKNRISCPTIYGFDLVLRPENGLEIYNLGFYEVGTLHVFKKCLKEGDIFIDVGASIGLMTLFSSKLVGTSGKVLAFEPTKNSFEDLSDAVRINDSKNIRTYNIGLGSEKKELRIYMNRACPSMVPGNDIDEPYEIVKIDKLDAVLEKENYHRIKMIKIDVEGYETEVLRGAIKLFSDQNAPIICIEYVKSFRKNTSQNEDPLNFIKQLNPRYQYYQLEKSSNTVSRLKKILDFQFHSNDNVYCFLPDHLQEIDSSLFIN